MGRIPRPGEIEERFRALVDQALTAEAQLDLPKYDPACHQLADVRAQARLADELLHRLVLGMQIAHPIVAEAIATVVVELGREIAPPPPPLHLRPLRLHKNCPHHRNRRRHRRPR